MWRAGLIFWPPASALALMHFSSPPSCSHPAIAAAQCYWLAIKPSNCYKEVNILKLFRFAAHTVHYCVPSIVASRVFKSFRSYARSVYECLMECTRLHFYFILYIFFQRLPLLYLLTMLTPALRWRVRSADGAKGRQGTVSVSEERL